MLIGVASSLSSNVGDVHAYAAALPAGDACHGVAATGQAGAAERFPHRGVSGDVPDAWEIALGGASRVYALADTVRGTARRNPAIAR
jgi:hypothetical protein